MKLRFLKTHGGKFYLANWIITHFPKDYEKYYYLEPFCGGANVFLQKKKSLYETLIDKNPKIINLLKVIQNSGYFMRFFEEIQKIEYNKFNFAAALSNSREYCDLPPINAAIKEYVLSRMSRGGLKKDFAWSNRLRNKKPGDVNSWESGIKLLPEISLRLRKAIILNNDSLSFLRKQSYKNCLIYCDPPYLQSTRSSKQIYGEHEMSETEHILLSEILNNCQAKVIVSGYSSDLYDKKLYKSWNRFEKAIANHAS